MRDRSKRSCSGAYRAPPDAWRHEEIFLRPFRRGAILACLVALATVAAAFGGGVSLEADSGSREVSRQINLDQRPSRGWVSATPTARPATVIQSLTWHAWLPRVQGPFYPLLFEDDFSNPGSGWPTADDGNILRGYDNGEYRVLIRQPGWAYLVTPGATGNNVQIDVDERYVGSGLGEAGVFFGVSDDFSNGAAILLSPSEQTAELWWARAGRWQFYEGIPTAALPVHSGSASNHLTITRTDRNIGVRVNGAAYNFWEPYGDETGFDGLMAVSLSNSSNADVRFDNFAVRSLVPPTPAATATPLATPTAISSQASDAVTLQVNPAHTGATASDGLVPPLTQRWSVDLGGTISSFPVIAQGKVFALVEATTGAVSLYALDASSGQVAWGPVAISTRGIYDSANVAYDATNLFVTAEDGYLRSYDANTGVLRWEQQYGPMSEPIAEQGVVYMIGGKDSIARGRLYAINELDGSVRWQTGEYDFNSTGLGLSGDSVFVSGLCLASKESRWNGEGVSAYLGNCNDGDTRTPSYYDGRVYVRGFGGDGNGVILSDGSTLSLVGNFQSDTLPAFSGHQGFYLDNHQLTSVDLTSGNLLWSFAGDGALDTPPLVAGNYVFVGSSNGNLYAVDTATGKLAWSTNVGGPIEVPNEDYGGHLTSPNVGDGLLVVPVGSKLIAFSGSGTQK